MDDQEIQQAIDEAVHQATLGLEDQIERLRSDQDEQIEEQIEELYDYIRTLECDVATLRIELNTIVNGREQ